MYPLKLYSRHPVTLVCLLASLLVNLAIWFWLATQIPPTGEPIFLHYNVLFGVDEIGDWSQIFFLPLAGLALVCVNGLLGWFCFQKDKYLAHLLNGMALVCQIFLLVAAALLVALNV